MEAENLVSEATFDRIIKEWNLVREEPKKISDNYVPSGKLNSTEELAMLEDKCKFVQYCRDNQADISEPLWYALASNLGRFEGGKEKFHNFSWKYPQYSIKETDAKFDHAFKASGPVTCAKIRQDGYNCSMTACGVESPAGLPKKQLSEDKKSKKVSLQIEKKAQTSEEIIPKPEGHVDESWKDDVEQLRAKSDPVEAGQQVRFFILTKLLHYDEITINRILKGPLKKKFSLDAGEIKGLLKAWKEEKNRKEIESLPLENIEEDQACYISNPIFERDGRIWKIKIKMVSGEKIPEEVPITTFTIEPIESITVEGKETLRVNIISGYKKFEIIFPPECWVSPKNFMTVLPSKEVTFTGNTVDVQHIRFFMSTFEMPHKKGVKTSGFHDEKFITEEGALSAQGVSVNIIYFNEVPTDCKLLSVKPATNKELAEIKKYIADFNTPIVTLPILGWTCACFFNLITSKILERRGLGNGFPLLNLQGEAGAGKTNTAKNIIMRMWAIESEPRSISELTKFTMMKMVDGSNSIPVVLEENKSCMQTDYFQGLISNLIRLTYNRLKGERGRADQTTQVYRYQTPVVIVGETGFTESALLDRFVTVFLSKKDSAPYLQGFKELRKQPLEKLGRVILEKALRMNQKEIEHIFEEELNAIDQNLIDRPRGNAAIVRFGLRILNDVLGTQFDMQGIDEAVKEGIREGDSSHRKSTVDKILEAMCLISEFQEKIITYKDGGKEEKQYKYQEHLEDGIDYEIINEPGIPVLKLFIAGAYSIFKKWAKAYKFEGDLLPQGSFSKQLKTEPYCIFIDHVKIGNKTRWGAKLDINKMRVRGLELSEFWGADPDGAPF